MVECPRCKRAVPDFLWVGDDHPVMLDHPVTIHRMDFPDKLDETKVTVHAYISNRKMCSDVIPTKPEPIMNFTVATELETAVFEALGAASACWDNLEGAGVFESTRCKQIGEELLEYFKAKGPIY